MISCTKNAVQKLESALDSTDCIRVGVITGGCSGYRYSLAVEEQQDKRENDVIVEFGNVKVYIDPSSAETLSHTVVDYVESIGSAGFKFENQKATNTCGCGASFASEGCSA